MTRIDFPLAPPEDGRLLAVVIPALDEQETIAEVVAAVPRVLPGIRAVSVVVVDDGSSDATAARARAAGADVIASHAANRGLAAAFNRGVREALALGADVVVNLDADGQHDPAQIPRLIAPILAGAADVTVGARPFDDASQGSPARRHGNRIGSALLRRATGIELTDFTSGFRAFSREALLELNVVSDYTYTLDTLIQAARKRLAVTEVVVPCRPRREGKSRMTRSIVRYVRRSGGQGLRSVLHANPLAVFGRLGVAAGLGAVVCGAWFLHGYQDGGMHLPSLLASLLLALFAGTLFVSALVADGTLSNRRLLEDALYRLKQLEAELAAPRAAEGPAAAGAGEAEVVELAAKRS
jgi:glycosyltransferase involved in cell wall biosynthesis